MREKDNSLDFLVSQVSMASAINTNLQWPKPIQSSSYPLCILREFPWGWVSLLRDPPHNQTAKGAGFYLCPSPGLGRRNSWAWWRSGLQSRDCTDALLPLPIPSVQTRAGSEPCAVFTDRLLEGQKHEQPPCSPQLTMTSTSKRGALRETKECSLQISHRAACITCTCLERLKTHPRFTEVPTGIRWLPHCLFLWSILCILFPLKHRRFPVSHLFCAEAASLLFAEKGGDEHRLTNNHHHAMLCYCTNPRGMADT